MNTAHSLKVTIEALASFPEKFALLFGCIPEKLRLWTPPSWEGVPSERLTAVEQVCHVRDVEIEGYRIRFERTRLEASPILPDLPGESMASERRYAAQDPLAALGQFARARAQNVEAIRGYSEATLRRNAIFEGRTTTLAGLVHFLSSHDHQHLSGLQWLLAKSEQTPDP
jgi:DinB family protein